MARSTLQGLLGSSLRTATVVLASTTVTSCSADADEDTGTSELEIKGTNRNKGNNQIERSAKDSFRFEALQHNIGGGTENDPGAAGIAYTFSRIDATSPDVVMLEEVCAAQYELFKARYPGWSVLWAEMTSNLGNDRCNGTPKGQLLASPRPMDEAIRKDLGESDGERKFTLLCGTVPIPDTQRKALACVTHLRAGKEETSAARDKQAWRIADTLKPEVNNGRAVVVGGDFNAGPGSKELDHLYRLTRGGKADGGAFDEADQTDADQVQFAAARDDVQCAPDACRTGEPTMVANRAKRDYVFFSHNRVARLGAGVDGSGGSAHKLYRAWAKLEF